MPMIRKIMALSAAAVIVVPVLLVWREPWQEMDEAAITARVAALLRYGAMDVPHEMAGPNHPQAALLARVAAGETLTVDESNKYRLAIQGVLADNQGLFRLLDNNIVFASDAGPNDPNNCGGLGIAGRHDLHAASAASNFAEMEASLAALETAGPFGRIRHANRAYKSLTDLMVHLAPAQASVMLQNQPALPAGANAMRAAGFDRFRRAITKAGFEPIGSPEHKAAMITGQVAYVGLALAVQEAITANLSPFEQRLAGRWLAVQSVSPRLTLPAE